MNPLTAQLKVWAAWGAGALFLALSVALLIQGQRAARWKAEASAAVQEQTRLRESVEAMTATLKEQTEAVEALRLAGARMEARVGDAAAEGAKARKAAEDVAMRLLSAPNVPQDPAKAQEWGSSVCLALGDEWRTGR